MKKSIYLETSVVSYFIGKPSRDIIIAGHQEITREWWECHLSRFKVVVSQFVIQEASGGDKRDAQERIRAINKFPFLDVTDGVEELANVFIKKGPIPRKAIIDALHIAVATVHGIDYLVTWNCTHIANAEMRTDLSYIADSFGYSLPVICTPEELKGDNYL